MAVTVSWDGQQSLGLELVEREGVPGHSGAVIKSMAPNGIVSVKGGAGSRLKIGMLVVGVNDDDTRSMTFLDTMQLLKRAVSGRGRTRMHFRMCTVHTRMHLEETRLMTRVLLFSLSFSLFSLPLLSRRSDRRASPSAPRGRHTSMRSALARAAWALASRTTRTWPRQSRGRWYR